MRKTEARALRAAEILALPLPAGAAWSQRRGLVLSFDNAAPPATRGECTWCGAIEPACQRSRNVVGREQIFWPGRGLGGGRGNRVHRSCGKADCRTAIERLTSWIELRLVIIERDRRTCVLCSNTRGLQDFEVDHITPVYHGGTDDPTNLRALCFPCHRDITAIQSASLVRVPPLAELVCL